MFGYEENADFGAFSKNRSGVIFQCKDRFPAYIKIFDAPSLLHKMAPSSINKPRTEEVMESRFRYVPMKIDSCCSLLHISEKVIPSGYCLISTFTAFLILHNSFGY